MREARANGEGDHDGGPGEEERARQADDEDGDGAVEIAGEDPDDGRQQPAWAIMGRGAF